MLAVLLLAGVVAAPVSSAALFVPIRRRGRAAGRWPAVRRFLLALVGTAVLAAVVAAVLRFTGVPVPRTAIAVAGLVFASLVWFWAARFLPRDTARVEMEAQRAS